SPGSFRSSTKDKYSTLSWLYIFYGILDDNQLILRLDKDSSFIKDIIVKLSNMDMNVVMDNHTSDVYNYLKVDIDNDYSNFINKVPYKESHYSDINFGSILEGDYLTLNEINFVNSLFRNDSDFVYSTRFIENIEFIQDILRINKIRKIYKENDVYYISNMRKEDSIEYCDFNDYDRESAIENKDELMFGVDDFMIYEENKDYINSDIIGWMTIESIEDTTNKYYDLNIPDGNLYIANNIVSHNSGKTHTANKIIEAFNINKEDVAFVAPTGMAAGV